MIITNRDRTEPLGACLASLAAQVLPPAWVILADLGSQPVHQAALAGLADRYQTSYLRIEYAGPWNKPLAFNTAFRFAVRALPAVTHVIQLDADVILHPQLLARAAGKLREVAAFCCLPRLGLPDLALWRVPGDIAGYQRMRGECGVGLPLALGVVMALPSAWLAEQRGFDEEFTGWGHEDTEMWQRVRHFLTGRKDLTGSMLIHQWHPRADGAGQQGPKWSWLIHRLANPAEAANPSGWGKGRITESVPRHGVARPGRDPVRASPRTAGLVPGLAD